MELLIRGGQLITLDQNRRILQADVAVVGGRIADLGNAADLIARHGQPQEILDASSRYVIPGVVNAHTHNLQAAFRGLGDGLPLHEWQRRVTHAAYLHLSAEDAYWFTLVGCLENIRSGVTTATNFQAFPNDLEACKLTARAFGESGLRGLLVKSFYAAGAPSELLSGREKVMADIEGVFAELDGAFDGRVRFCVATPGARSAPAEWLRQAHSIAARYGSGVHIHVAAEAASVTSQLGMPEIVYYDSLGIVDSRFQGAHCVAITPKEMQLLAQRGGHVIHCPISNMYLANGIADISALESAGVNVALGSDGPASNNNQDMFAVMKVTSLLEKVTRRNTFLLPPGRVLEMATKDGARAANVDAGVIEPGRLADLAVVDLSGPHNQPLHRPVSALVYSAHAEDVESVVVGGKIVMRNRQIQTLNEREVIAEAQRRIQSLFRRSGLAELKAEWPWC